MKKDLFKIDSDEVKRILSLHEERSKNQYLGILSEQEIPQSVKNVIQKQVTPKNTTGSYTIGSNTVTLENSNKLKGELKLFKGTTFKKQPNSDKLVAKTKYQYVDSATGNVVKSAEDQTSVSRDEERTYTYNGTVTYLCQSGKFVTDTSKGYQYFDEDGGLVKQLKSVCAFKGTSTPEKQPNTSVSVPSGGYVIQNPYTIANGAIKIQKGDVVTKYGNNAIIKRGKDLVTSFDCSTGKFNTRVGQANVDGNKTILSDTIKSKFCKSSAVTTTTTTVAPSGGGTGGGVSRQSQIATVTKQIQTSLGSKTPTGKITEPELDAILTKLT